MSKVVHLVVIAITALAMPVMAGLGTITGKEWGLWTEDRTSVIAATIRDVRKWEGGDYGQYRATLVPLATLAGSLDPSLNPQLPVQFYVSDLTSSIRLSKPLPKDGSTVLAVVQMPKPQNADREKPAGFIVSDICTFMPDGSALVPIDGLGDAKVAETLKKIQVARANANPSPYGKPITRPSGTLGAAAGNREHERKPDR